MKQFKIVQYDEKLAKEITREVSTKNEITIGNPVSTYLNETERSVKNFLLKPNSLSLFASAAQEQGQLTILDLGCGNGSNSRLLASLLAEEKNDLKIHIIYTDVSLDLLEEAGLRTINMFGENGRISFELVQINFGNIESLKRFSKDFRNRINFAFSVKFLYNVPLRINSEKAKCVAEFMKKNGVFLIQTYNHVGLKINIKLGLKFLLGLAYGNSTQIDRFFLKLKMNSAGMKPAYAIHSKASQNFTFLNHFNRNSSEFYFIKQ